MARQCWRGAKQKEEGWRAERLRPPPPSGAPPMLRRSLASRASSCTERRLFRSDPAKLAGSSRSGASMATAPSRSRASSSATTSRIELTAAFAKATWMTKSNAKPVPWTPYARAIASGPAPKVAKKPP